MKKFTLLSLLLLLCGAVGVKAQGVVPQVSTGEIVYEYHLLFPHLSRYAKNSTTNGYVLNTQTSSEYLRVKLVASATEDYVNIVPTNVSGGENYNFICAEGTTTNAKIKYSETAATNGEWKLSVDESTLKAKLALKGYEETLGLANGTSTVNSALILYTKNNAHSDIYFVSANANAENATVLPKVETILANGGKTGYLAATDALHTALQTAYNSYTTSGTSENLAAVKTAYDNYKASTAVVQPSAGTVYHIDWIFAAPKSIYNSGDVKWGTFDASKNNYYWKIVDGKLMNGNGQYIQWDGTDSDGDHLTVTGDAAEATAVVITPIAGDNQFKIKFAEGNRYFHANDHGSGGGSGSNIITWDTSAGSDGASAWRFNEISGYDLYTVAVTGLPEEMLYEGGVSLNNTDQKAYNGGFFVKKGDAFANTDFTALSVEGFQGNSITVSGNTITVSYRINDAAFSANLRNHIDNDAQPVLDKRGVGYPMTTSAAYADFAAAIATAETAIKNHDENGISFEGTEIDDLLAAIDTYKATTTGIQMPEGGKAYTITSVNINGVQRYMNYTEGTGYSLVNRTNDPLPMTAVLICRDLGGDKYAFVNNDGKYFMWRGNGVGNNDHKGYLDAYDATNENSNTVLTVEKITVGGSVTGTQDALFGYMAMKGNRNNGNTPNYFVIKTAGGYDHADQKFFNSGFSSALLIEEVTDYAYPTPALKDGTIDGEKMAIGTFSSPFPTDVPAGVKAFYVQTADNGTATLTRIPEGNAIPGGQGVILTADAGTTTATMLPAITPQGDVTGNMLVASSEGISSFEGYSNAYVLGAKNGNIAFYKASASGTKLGKNKAYLQLSEGAAPALIMSFGNGEATGIEGVEAVPAAQEGAIFDLSGRRVLNPTKGLYIIGGKKVYIK